MFGVSPNTYTANGNVPYRYFATGYYCIYRTCHSKQFLVGLLMLSDGLVYFLKNPPKLSCGFKKNCLGDVLEIYLTALQIYTLDEHQPTHKSMRI